MFCEKQGFLNLLGSFLSLNLIYLQHGIDIQGSYLSISYFLNLKCTFLEKICSLKISLYSKIVGFTNYAETESPREIY